MTEVISKTRTANENEFFFHTYTNIGNSDEFKRFLDYINTHSNIIIEKVSYQTIDQMSVGNHHGGPYNLKITGKKDGK